MPSEPTPLRPVRPVTIYRRRPFYLKRRFMLPLLAVFGGGMVLFVALALFLHPFRKKAAEFDLEEIGHLETASIVYDRDGREIGRIYVENRKPIRIADVPYHFVQALMAKEDARFFRHKGVDVMGITRAALTNLRTGKRTQGASTITQQLARQSFGLMKKKMTRKFVEMFLARRIERAFTKAEILELYLNRIYFGGGFYGLEAAAVGYFGKSARDLTIEESATICGLIKSPNRYSPLRHPKESKEQRDYVLVRMRTEEMISPEECERLQELPLTVNPGKMKQAQQSYVFEQVRQRVLKVIDDQDVSRDGLRIETTIDLPMQEIAAKRLRQELDRVETMPGYRHQSYRQYQEMVDSLEKKDAAPSPKYLQGAILVLDNDSGALIASVGGRDFADSEFNRAFQSRRPAGSAFKPFVYATAFEEGVVPYEKIKDAPIDNRMVMIGGQTGILGEWGVEKRHSTYEGEVTVRHALAASKNAATVRLGMKVGLEKVAAFARRAGVESKLREYSSTFLGSSEVSLSEMCLGYTTFARNGRRPARLSIVRRILDRKGAPVYVNPWLARTEEVTNPVTAYQVHDCLVEALDEGTGSNARKRYGLEDIPAAGKTGTAYDFTDVWFVGYTSSITCGVWVGFDAPQSIYPGAFGNEIALPVWVDVVNQLNRKWPATALQPPPEAVKVEICEESGLRATDSCYEVDESLQGPQKRYVRCTHAEYVRRGAPLLGQLCHVHSENPEMLAGMIHPKYQAKERKAASRHVINATAVPLKSPTLLGDDPYGTEQGVPPALLTGADGTEEAAVPAARPVRRFQFDSGLQTIRLQPPPPIDFTFEPL